MRYPPQKEQFCERCVLPLFAIVDYGVGNLFSLQCSLTAIGIEAEVTGDANRLERASHIILPGVGAFGDAIQKLRASGLEEPVKQLAKAGKPLLGICLGMQLLFEHSDEFGEHPGLCLVPGNIVSMQAALDKRELNYKVPQIGWNSLDIVDSVSPIMKYSRADDWVYYVHSYYATDCENSLVASSDYGVQVPGVVQNANVYGTQFHPEKSGAAGLRIVKAFAEVEP